VVRGRKYTGARKWAMLINNGDKGYRDVLGLRGDAGKMVRMNDEINTTFVPPPKERHRKG
jgi:hypothetical protein